MLFACLFDPLGIIVPLVITLKALLQDTWRSGISWNDPLPEKTKHELHKWIQAYTCSPRIEFQRLMFSPALKCKFELHVFTDASQMVMGAAVYVRRVTSLDIQASFLIGRAKIAPLKQTSIPKLELQAAVIGTWLNTFVLIEWAHPSCQRFLLLVRQYRCPSMDSLFRQANILCRESNQQNS